jgi:hypothetical protein
VKLRKRTKLKTRRKLKTSVYQYPTRTSIEMKKLINSLLNLENDQCRFIDNEAYCQEKKLEGFSYCVEHKQKVYRCLNKSKEKSETIPEAQTKTVHLSGLLQNINGNT